MEIPKIYDPKQTEARLYAQWMNKNYFRSVPDSREAYTIVIPPPNVTGVLHMGHMLNNTIQDVLVRRARMLGKNACWVPGTDHASIATEAKVVNLLRSKGIEKSSLTREEFLAHCWEWKEKHGGIILEQLKKLGASCDWERTRFTMEEDLSTAVLDVFVDLYKKGLIYRGVRMINWDPKALTALSDEEVIYKEVSSKLFFIKYPIEDSTEFITVATTRPETILGDTAICVNPNDQRYAKLKGKFAFVPLINRRIPIIFDEYVDMEFGTGALKVTPAHDINDYNLGIKHNLPCIDVLNENGTMSEAAGMYIGEDRFTVRETIGDKLREAGLLAEVKEMINKVGYSERTDVVIEPKLSLQWFCNMATMAKPALDHVMDDQIQFHPAKFKNSYRHWMENVKDWCISRQLWWGQRIPAWYFGEAPNDFVVCKTRQEAEKMLIEKGLKEKTAFLRQDEDVLDTWFSSWLWPISVFDGFKDPNNKDIQYYYPTNDLVTAPEIMFFWVARMIMAGYEYRGELPFKNVYYTGIVRDKLRRKMSKSLGNSPDPLDLIDKYGADGVRVGMLLSSPAGNDLMFDESLCEQGRNFTNKLWNAFRLLGSWETDDSQQPEYAKQASKWFENRLSQALLIINDHYDKFRMSDALMATYKLVWDDFCSWYLELIKPPYQTKMDPTTKAQAEAFMETLLKICHPFTPFITEEIWQTLRSRGENETIMYAAWPESKPCNESLQLSFELTCEVIGGIRNLRKELNLPNKDALAMSARVDSSYHRDFDALVIKLGNLSSFAHVIEKPEGTQSFIVRSNEFFVHLNQAELNVEEQLAKLKEELDYTKGFLQSVMKKLSNEKFVAGAPEQVVVMEKKKQSDAENKIKILEEKMASLGA